MGNQFTRGSGVIYRGPSMLESGEEIAVLVTGLAAPSGNEKTGAMIQTHIVRVDTEPGEAIRLGMDSGSVCPSKCPHRSKASGGNGDCYTFPSILRGHGTAGSWGAFNRGRYRRYGLGELATLGASRDIRLGSYGDPGAVPIEIWDALLSESVSNTGYTHAWRTSPGLARWCMASVDSVAEATEAMRLGFRFYLPEPVGAAPTRRIGGETVAQCPASAEAGRRVTCSTCPKKLRCSGTRHGSQIAGVRIEAHGSGARSLRAQ